MSSTEIPVAGFTGHQHRVRVVSLSKPTFDFAGSALLLVRRAVEIDSFRHALRSFRPERGLVFLHGQAVCLARDPLWSEALRHASGAWVGMVCRSAWQRRFEQEPVPGPWISGGLLQLFDALTKAAEWRVFGSGGASAGQREAAGSGAWLIEIRHAVEDAREARETLEVALAAAALELDCAVLFDARGLTHLRAPYARAWRQISDYQMLRLVTPRAAPTIRAEVEVEPLARDAIQRLADLASIRLLL